MDWIRIMGQFMFGHKLSPNHSLNSFNCLNYQHDLWVDQIDMGDQNQDCAAGGSVDAEHDHVKKVGLFRVRYSLFLCSLVLSMILLTNTFLSEINSNHSCLYTDEAAHQQPKHDSFLKTFPLRISFSF